MTVNDGEESSDHPRVGVETQYRMSNKLRITEAKPQGSVQLNHNGKDGKK
jgi:hypothetical protein